MVSFFHIFAIFINSPSFQLLTNLTACKQNDAYDLNIETF